MKIGDQVVLNSGGPLMTVEEVKDNRVGCVWYDVQQSKICNYIFVDAMLRVKNDEEGEDAAG